MVRYQLSLSAEIWYNARIFSVSVVGGHFQDCQSQWCHLYKPSKTVFLPFIRTSYYLCISCIPDWSGNDKGTGGVGVLLAEEWWEKVFEVVRVSDRIIIIRMTIAKQCLCLCVCMHLKQTLVSLRRTVSTRCCNARYPKSQLQNSSLSVVTGMGTLDPSPLGSRRCMAARPLEKGNWGWENIKSLHLLTSLLSGTHGSRRNQNTWSPTSLGMLLPR